MLVCIIGLLRSLHDKGKQLFEKKKKKTGGSMRPDEEILLLGKKTTTTTTTTTTPSPTPTTELLLTFLKVQKRRHISLYSFMQVLTLLEIFEMPHYVDSSKQHHPWKKKKNAPPISKFFNCRSLL